MRILCVLSLFMLSVLPSFVFAATKLSDFNPAISATLMGHVFYDNKHNKSPTWLNQLGAFPNQGDALENPKSFNLDGSEIIFSSNVDHYFKAFLAVGLSDEEIELEEAWLQSSALPLGLQVKAGRFLSNFAYQNTQHKHDWDFMSQNLAYQSILYGEHLHGDGIQLSILLPTDNYWLLGLEAMQTHELRGFGQEIDSDAWSDELGSPVNFSRSNRPQFLNAFMHYSPDIGTQYGLQLGLSFAQHSQQENIFLHDTGFDAAQGKSHLYSSQIIWKKFARDSYGTGGFSFIAEYFYLHSKLNNLQQTGNSRQSHHAMYWQFVYGIAPRLELGLRYSASGFAQSHVRLAEANLRSHHSEQTDLLIAWRLSEFSRLRFEASYLSAYQGFSQQKNTGGQFKLGYVVFIGAHPAHTF